MILMNGDNETLRFDFDDEYIEVVNDRFLPFGLKGYLRSSDFSSKEQIKQSYQHIYALKDYLMGRTLNLSKENAKQILNALALPQSLKTDEKLKIVFACQGLSMTDNIWIKEDSDKRLFPEVNLRNHRLRDAAVPVSLLGRTETLTNEELRPDIGVNGLFAKTWYRGDGAAELWKTDKTDGKVNTMAEIQVSDILDSSNVTHVKYWKGELADGTVVCKCKNIANDDISVIDGYEFKDYCCHNDIDMLSFLEANCLEDLAKMCVADFVLANTDRHLGNIHFLINNSNNTFISMAPLFDHNQALIADYFGTDISDLPYELTGNTIYESACRYYKRSGFEIDKAVLPPKCAKRLAQVEIGCDIQTYAKL